MKRKILAVPLILFLVIALLFIGTGFLPRSNVALVNYSVSDDHIIHMTVSITTSMGYTRGFRAEEKENICYVTFLSTFGGLNSSLGAKSEFDLGVSADCEAIYFLTGDEGYRQVLIKENGQWQESE